MVTVVVALVVGVSIVIVLWLVRASDQTGTAISFRRSPPQARDHSRTVLHNRERASGAWIRLRSLIALAGLILCLGALLAAVVGGVTVLVNDVLRDAAAE